MRMRLVLPHLYDERVKPKVKRLCRSSQEIEMLARRSSPEDH
jgi:hypothetical protein